jgi:hypothetical protein
LAWISTGFYVFSELSEASVVDLLVFTFLLGLTRLDGWVIGRSYCLHLECAKVWLDQDLRRFGSIGRVRSDQDWLGAGAC